MVVSGASHPTKSPGAVIYKFDDCELDEAARTLRVAGQAVELEPRPLALLLYLIRCRQRVVTHEELLRKVWGGQPASDAAVRRTVLKARQALGASGVVIKTVPRVGLRFTGQLAQDPAGGSDTLTLALLPLVNRTGDADLAWACIGLQEMLGEALAGHAQLQLVSPKAVMDTVTANPAVTRLALADAVQRDTGANTVLCGSLHRQGAGFGLSFQIYGSVQTPPVSVEAAQVLDLVPEVLGALVSLLDGFDVSSASLGAGFTDDMAAEAYGRGLAAALEQRWAKAASLFRLSTELEPSPVGPRLMLLRALAPLAADSEEVDRLAAGLLAQADPQRDWRIESGVYGAWGYHRFRRRRLEEAVGYLEKALQVAAGRGEPDWQAQTALWLGAALFHQHQLVPCQRRLDEARRQCEASGNRRLMLSVWTLETCLASVDGDLERMVVLAGNTVRAARELKAASAICDSSANASIALVELGRFAQAAAYGEEALAATMTLGERSRIEDSVANLCWLYRLAEEPEASRRTLAKLDAIPGPCSLIQSVDRARGFDAAAQGKHAEAARCFAASLTEPIDREFAATDRHTVPWLIEALILSDQDAEAADLLQRMRTAFPDDSAELRLHVLSLQALLAWRQGNLPEALGSLDQAVAVGKFPLYTTWALADAAWVQLKAGHEALAAAYLRRVPESLLDLPAVVRVRAALYATKSARGAMLASTRKLPSRH